MFRTVFIGGATAAVLAAFTPTAGSAEAPAAPVPPGKVTIDLVSVNGSGCRPGTAKVAVSPDNTAFTVTYSEYLAQVGKGSKPTDFRKNCQLGLNVHAPQGFTYGVAKADYRGFAHLEEGTVGSQQASYYFQGMSATTTQRSKNFIGPMEGNWQVTHTVPYQSIVHKKCGEQRNININTQLLVNGGWSDTDATNSFMAMDSTDGSLNTKYHFSWKKCER
ncbi:DUF4360 domain-containing protein [Streptomyces sp. NPDC059009]|uniref:DUF4360 domain-containing protein n=1 Tax=Streptomyces sp. NPDC059009 TaxID=3346694 RepID=UPI0036CD96BF